MSKRTKSQKPPELLLVPDPSVAESKQRPELIVIRRKLRHREKDKKSRRNRVAFGKALVAMAYLLEWSPNRHLIHGIAMALGDCSRQVHGLRTKGHP